MGRSHFENGNLHQSEELVRNAQISCQTALVEDEYEMRDIQDELDDMQVIYGGILVRLGFEEEGRGVWERIASRNQQTPSPDNVDDDQEVSLPSLLSKVNLLQSTTKKSSSVGDGEEEGEEGLVEPDHPLYSSIQSFLNDDQKEEEKNDFGSENISLTDCLTRKGGYPTNQEKDDFLSSLSDFSGHQASLFVKLLLRRKEFDEAYSFIETNQISPNLLPQLFSDMSTPDLGVALEKLNQTSTLFPNLTDDQLFGLGKLCLLKGFWKLSLGYLEKVDKESNDINEDLLFAALALCQFFKIVIFFSYFFV